MPIVDSTVEGKGRMTRLSRNNFNLAVSSANQMSVQPRQRAPAFSNLADRIFLAYFPSLPAKPAADLWRYCIATGVLFRTWVRHKDDAGKGFMEFKGSARKVVDDVLARWEMGVKEVGGAAKEELGHLVAREGRVLKALVERI